MTSSSCPKGQVALVIGDGHRHGVPAGSSWHDAEHPRSDAPAPRVNQGAVLARANALLHGRQSPTNMFVTCLYAVLEPATGRLLLRERGPRPALRARRPRRSGLRATGCRSA